MHIERNENTMSKKNRDDKPTFDEVQNEFEHCLASIGLGMSHVFGNEAATALIKTINPTWEWNDSTKGVFTSMDLFESLYDLYAYAFNAYGYADDAYIEHLEWIVEAATSPEIFRIKYAELEQQGEYESPRAISKMIQLGTARSLLDDMRSRTDPLHIEQVAALAGMSVRSVQNALSLTGEAKLTGTRIGNNSYVIEQAEARRWLSTKKGFTPTIKPASTEAKTWPKNIESMAQLMRLAEVRAQEMQVLQELDAAVAGGSFDKAKITISDALQIAAVLQIDSKTLLNQILQLAHPAEAKILNN